MHLLYIDPGSGAILLQLIASALIGSVLFFREKIVSVYYFISGNKPISSSVETENAEESTTEESQEN